MDMASFLTVLFCAVISLIAQAQAVHLRVRAATQSRTIVLDSHSQVSLSDAYGNVCSNGGMLVITPNYTLSEPIPTRCESQPAVLDLRRPDSLTGKLNVKTEGAVGDGNADDTAALQKAIQYAVDHQVGSGPRGSPVVYLAPGTYKVSKALRVPAQLHLIGDGPETTTLILTSPVGNLITVYPGKCSDWSCNGSLEGVGLIGSGHLTTGTLLEVTSADGFHIRDVKMSNPAVAVCSEL